MSPVETTAHYHDPQDKRFQRNLREGAPGAFSAFVAFDEAALRGQDKVIPRKYTELIALSVALTTQCAYCIEAHSVAAADEGATEAEIAEAVFITAALRAGGGMAHGLLAMKFHQAATREDATTTA